MIGIGTLINVGCILLGGIIGYFSGNHLKENIRETLLTMTGIGVVVIGLGGTLTKMLSISNGQLTSDGSIMMIVSLAIGTVIGEIMQIEEKVFRFGEWLKRKSNSGGDNSFVDGLRDSIVYGVYWSDGRYWFRRGWNQR